MFDILTFYKGLLARTDYFDNYWDQFPTRGEKQFMLESTQFLAESIKSKDGNALACALAIISVDGADESFTDALLLILNEKWHIEIENIVRILQMIKDPKSINALFDLCLNVPDYDEMRAIAKKCMWAFKAIHTEEAKEKLLLLSESTDWIIRENAVFQLEHWEKKRG